MGSHLQVHCPATFFLQNTSFEIFLATLVRGAILAFRYFSPLNIKNLLFRDDGEKMAAGGQGQGKIVKEGQVLMYEH